MSWWIITTIEVLAAVLSGYAGYEKSKKEKK